MMRYRLTLVKPDRKREGVKEREMLRTRLTIIRPLLTRGAVCTGIHLQRATRDPVEKYKAQLEKKAREVGAGSIDELKEKMKDTIKERREQFNRVDPLAELEEYERKCALEAQEKMKKEGKLRDPRAPGVPEKPYKTLDSYVATDKLQELAPETIGLIWRARFEQKEDALLSIVPADVFDKLFKNARENPIFVLPLPRGDGTEFHYVQWAFVGPDTVHCMFTTLLEFKTHKEYARPHTTVSFHTELKQSKGIVLMNGHVEKESAVKLPDAQLLMLNIQRFYGAMSETETAKRRLQMLRDFTSGSPAFSFDQLIAEAQSLEN